MDFAKRIIENPGKYSADSLTLIKSFVLVIFRLKREEQSLSNIRKSSIIISSSIIILLHCLGQFYIQCNNDEEKYDAVKTIYSSDNNWTSNDISVVINVQHMQLALTND